MHVTLSHPVMCLVFLTLPKYEKKGDPQEDDGKCPPLRPFIYLHNVCVQHTPPAASLWLVLHKFD